MTYYMSNLGVPLFFQVRDYNYGQISYEGLTLDRYADTSGVSSFVPYSVDLSKPADSSKYPTVEELRQQLNKSVSSIVVKDQGIVDIYKGTHLEYNYGSPFIYGFSSVGNSNCNVIIAVGGAFISVDGRNHVFVPYDQIITGDHYIDCPVARDWGGAQYKDCGPFWDHNNMADFFSSQVANKYLYRVQFTQASVSAKFQGKVSMYMNKKDKERDRKTACRPGRAFKFLFPELPDIDIAKLVDRFNEKFPVVNLTLHEGKDEDSFIKAYSYEQSVMQNVYTSCSRKSLANSCMRFRPEHENLPKHPSAAYASGDFLSLWTEDEGGRIASRCVVYVPEEGKPQAGPVYGTSENAIDLIESKLRDMNAAFYNDAVWIGARLLHIPCKGGVLAPYLDHEKGLSEGGGFLTIVDGGDGHRGVDYYADTYSGVLGASNVCADCDERIYDGDEFTSDDGTCYCSDCYNDRYMRCYESEDEHPRGDLTLCRVSSYRWGYHEEMVYDPAQHGYCEIGDYWYHPDLVIVTEQDTEHLIDADTYFICDETGEYHDFDQRVEANIHGQVCNVSKTWVDDNDYVLNSDNIYELKEEEKEAA